MPPRLGGDPPISGTVIFDDVSFSYGNNPALDHASFTFNEREVVAVAGPNGAGKSTILRLVVGLAEPGSGSIRLGGIDLGKIDIEAWRRTVAYLPQRAFLPDRGSVREAIGLLARDASEGAIERALTMTGLWGVLHERSPDAPLSVAVASLSAGERQRLALSRVIAQDAKVYVLDEPDANLDANGIEMVANLVRALSAKSTVIVAAHTPEVLEAADRVVTLDAAHRSTMSGQRSVTLRFGEESTSARSGAP
jgi:ABC-type multidrug transport system fused ATPase/permease subunit